MSRSAAANVPSRSIGGMSLPRRRCSATASRVQRVEDEVARAVPRLQLEHDAAVFAEPEPILRDRRPEHVAAELLQALTILPIHSDIAVEIEAVQMGVARSTGADPLRLPVSSQGHQPRARPRAQRYASLHRRAAETRQHQRVLRHRVGPRYSASGPRPRRSRSRDAGTNGGHEVGHLRIGGRRQGMKLHGVKRGREHAVEYERVEVDVQVERSAESSEKTGRPDSNDVLAADSRRAASAGREPAPGRSRALTCSLRRPTTSVLS